MQIDRRSFLKGSAVLAGSTMVTAPAVLAHAEETKGNSSHCEPAFLLNEV